MVTIKNWGVTSYNDNPYAPPEYRCARLMGEVYGHPNYEDGHMVVTSPIVSADGKIVTTRSREYSLGEPSPEYLTYLESINYIFDPENPVKVLNRSN